MILNTHDPLRAVFELREQLAPATRRLAFFFGAGTSMAVGLPGIRDLTSKVQEMLDQNEKVLLDKLICDLKKGLTIDVNIEHILDRIRTIRELIGEDKEKETEGFKRESAISIDQKICNAIYQVMNIDPPKGLSPHKTLAQWLHQIPRDYPVEIFTTNYDLLLERAMEQAGVPFFDGFVGSVEPFFVPESVEADGSKVNVDVFPPRGWTRLWKVHGSIGWHLLKDSATGVKRIARIAGREPTSGEELMIFPSREKYTDSRKLPFLAYQDRLRQFLSNGEALILTIGYRFGDEHINEIIFQGLRSNSRLAIVALLHGELEERLIAQGYKYRNLTLYGSDKACLGGIIGNWGEPSRKRKVDEAWPFWDEEKKRFTLGDFNAFASYLELFIGFRSPGLGISPLTDLNIQPAKAPIVATRGAHNEN